MRWKSNDKPDATLPVLILLILVVAAPIAVVGITRYFKYIRIEQNLTGKLKQAADSNGIPLAQEKLGEVIKWMEDNGYTGGSSHVWIKTPPHDIKFFYDNLVSAKEDLDNFPPPPPSMPSMGESNSQAQSNYDLAESNQLMKLRETLVDEGGDGGPEVTCPPNMAVYPNQMLWWWLIPVGIVWVLSVAGFGYWKWDWNGPL